MSEPAARRRRLVLATLAAGAVVLGGCAGLATRPTPPKIEVAGITGASLVGNRLSVTVALIARNPNAFDVGLDALEADVTIEGTRTAVGRMTSPVVLAANADTPVEVETRTDIDVLGGLLERIVRRGRLAYEITGFAVLGDGRRLDYRKKGEVAAADFLGRLR